METKCMYCEKNKELLKLMIPIFELEKSNVYLFKNQFYRGRCIVAAKTHVDELFELDESSRDTFMWEVAIVAKTIKEIYHADKINYAVYGDVVSHLHFHIVPKIMGHKTFGQPFELDGDEVFLEDEEYTGQIKYIIEKLKENKK